MNILVIGNGFDLAHKLPTRYNDFLGFVERFLNIINTPQILQQGELKNTERLCINISIILFLTNSSFAKS